MATTLAGESNASLFRVANSEPDLYSSLEGVVDIL